jgi:hypothetical protein
MSSPLSFLVDEVSRLDEPSRCSCRCYSLDCISPHPGVEVTLQPACRLYQPYISSQMSFRVLYDQYSTAATADDLATRVARSRFGLVTSATSAAVTRD